jgi:Fe-S-cluster containining protein
MSSGRTLGQLIADEQLLPWLGAAIADIHRFAGKAARAAGKPLRLTVTCTSCTATKTCCWSMVVARLYEGVLIAGHLRAAGRDTPDLRDQLAERAAAMEAASPYEWRTPCVFLDARERCTVYAARPTACGTLLVYTDPVLCTTRAQEIRAYVPREEVAAATALEEELRARLSLRKKVGRRYLGVLPRMVLVSLEAWDREDFRDYLRQLPWPTEEELARFQPAGAS